VALYHGRTCHLDHGAYSNTNNGQHQLTCAMVFQQSLLLSLNTVAHFISKRFRITSKSSIFSRACCCRRVWRMLWCLIGIVLSLPLSNIEFRSTTALANANATNQNTVRGNVMFLFWTLYAYLCQAVSRLCSQAKTWQHKHSNDTAAST
jgi:hypothetical protein